MLPLSRHETLVPTARQVYSLLSQQFVCQYDDSQSIGRRYRRQDEIGTLFCVTIDFDTLSDKQITIRSRDSMKQIRVPIDGLIETLANHTDMDSQ